MTRIGGLETAADAPSKSISRKRPLVALRVLGLAHPDVDVVRIVGSGFADPAVRPLVEVHVPRLVEGAMKDFDGVGWTLESTARAPAAATRPTSAALSQDAA